MSASKQVTKSGIYDNKTDSSWELWNTTLFSEPVMLGWCSKEMGSKGLLLLESDFKDFWVHNVDPVDLMEIFH
jgi:hypothetical protein